MKKGTAQFSACAFVFCALLLAPAALGQVLTITAGGRRVIDRDPDSAAGNCLGWTYGASPAIGPYGELLGMYTSSDALTHHCTADIGLDSAQRFGDAIQFHSRLGGEWGGGVNVIDRAQLPWMNDVSFLNAEPQTFAGHVASPSVVFRDGRWYMAFAASLNDRNLCAGEHYSGNACGSCFDPWSYFAIVWAVSDDGVNWRVRERAPGDPTFLGRPPNAIERTAPSNYKGFTRVALIAHENRWYLAAQYWSRTSLKVAMFRAPYDPSSEWGVTGQPEVWNGRLRAWVNSPDFLDLPFDYSLTSFSGILSSIRPTRVFGDERFIAVNPDSRGSSIVYQTSQNLIDWTPPVTMRSSIPFFADGGGYSVSVIDPVAVDGDDGKLHVFFASADGDSDHGIDRDGRHDCGLYSDFGPTAVYLGIGIYEGIAEPLALRPTVTSLSSARSGRFDVRVVALDGSVPEGNVVIADGAGDSFRIVPLVNGSASADLTFIVPGQHLVSAWYDAQGQWDASRAPALAQNVTFPRRRTVRSGS